MIERFLFTAMKDGLALFKAEPELLDDLFSWLAELDATEVEAIKTWFAANPPNLYHGYAPPAYELPFYSIVLAGESESEDVIGDDGGMCLDEEDEENYQENIETAFWDHEYHVLCYSEGIDTTRYMYEIAKSIMVHSHAYFIAQDLFKVRVAGADLAPDAAHLPPHLFVRMLKFSCSSEFATIERGSRIGKAFRVGGIHAVDSRATIDDVGGVKTLVTPYIEGSED